MEILKTKTIMTKSNQGNRWFGIDYHMNLYKGCPFGCIYCDSRCEAYHIENFDEVRIKENALVIGADTVVVLDDEILGKPKDEAEAISMLKRLSGRKHKVVTAIAVINTENNTVKKTAVTSYVEFEQLTDEQIESYVKEYKPLDKAGSYGIQELPSGFVKNVEGSFKNIIGLCPDALMKLIV